MKTRITRFKSPLIDVLLSLILSFVVGGIIIGIAYYSFAKTVRLTLTEVAKQVSQAVEAELSNYLDTLEAIAGFNEISGDVPISRKMSALKNEAKRKGFLRISLADAKGYAVTTDGKSLFIGDRSYFKKALAGIPNISEPLNSRVDGRRVVVFAVPVFSDRQVIGVLYSTRDMEFLSNLTNNLRFGGIGNTFIIDRQGDTIAHDNQELVRKRDNDFKNIIKDPRLKRLVSLERQMVDGKSGAGEYIYHGIHKYLGFAPVAETGWSVGVAAPKTLIFADAIRIFWFMGLILLAVIGWVTFLVFRSKYLQKSLAIEKSVSETAINTAGIMIVGIDEVGRIDQFSRLAEEKTGLNFTEVRGKMLNSYVAFDITDIQAALLERRQVEFSWINCKTGQTVYGLWSINQKLIEDGGPPHYELIGLDISERVNFQAQLQIKHEQLVALYQEVATTEEELRSQYRELEKAQSETKRAEQRYELATEGSRDIIWEWEQKNDRLYVTNRIYEILGYQEVVMKLNAHTCQALLHPDDRDDFLKKFATHIHAKLSYMQAEFRMRARNGSYKCFLARATAIYDQDGMATFAGSITDITDQKEDEATIHRLAYYDPLTGLPNRVCLLKELSSNPEKWIGSKATAAIIVSDVANFKMINQVFGHSFGDKVLVGVAGTLRKIVGSQSLLAKFDGDKFAIVVPYISDLTEVSLTVKKIVEGFSNRLVIDGNGFKVDLNIGVAPFNFGLDLAEDVLKNAQAAMYKAKETGNNCFVYYDRSMQDNLARKLQMELSLREAIANHELEVYYQPIYSLGTGTLNGFEALLRWDSPKFGKVSPEIFIPLAEESGLILSLGKWVMEETCHFAKYINQFSNNTLQFSINISVIQLMASDFVETVKTVLNSSGISGNLIALEITESALMSSFDRSINKLLELKDLGLQLYLDDFGTGYSSLNYLKNLPIDTVKIDKTFVRDLADNLLEVDLLSSIIGLVNRLGLNVVAEGIETQEQVEFLQNCRCHFGQGFLFSKPVPQNEVIKIITQKNDLEKCGMNGFLKD